MPHDQPVTISYSKTKRLYDEFSKENRLHIEWLKKFISQVGESWINRRLFSGIRDGDEVLVWLNSEQYPHKLLTSNKNQTTSDIENSQWLFPSDIANLLLEIAIELDLSTSKPSDFFKKAEGNTENSFVLNGDLKNEISNVYASIHAKLIDLKKNDESTQPSSNEKEESSLPNASDLTSAMVPTAHFIASEHDQKIIATSQQVDDPNIESNKTEPMGESETIDGKNLLAMARDPSKRVELLKLVYQIWQAHQEKQGSHGDSTPAPNADVAQAKLPNGGTTNSFGQFTKITTGETPDPGEETLGAITGLKIDGVNRLNLTKILNALTNTLGFGSIDEKTDDQINALEFVNTLNANQFATIFLANPDGTIDQKVLEALSGDNGKLLEEAKRAIGLSLMSTLFKRITTHEPRIPQGINAIPGSFSNRAISMIRSLASVTPPNTADAKGVEEELTIDRRQTQTNQFWDEYVGGVRKIWDSLTHEQRLETLRELQGAKSLEKVEVVLSPDGTIPYPTNAPMLNWNIWLPKVSKLKLNDGKATDQKPVISSGNQANNNVKPIGIADKALEGYKSGLSEIQLKGLERASLTSQIQQLIKDVERKLQQPDLNENEKEQLVLDIIGSKYHIKSNLPNARAEQFPPDDENKLFFQRLQDLNSALEILVGKIKTDPRTEPTLQKTLKLPWFSTVDKRSLSDQKTPIDSSSQPIAGKPTSVSQKEEIAKSAKSNGNFLLLSAALSLSKHLLQSSESVRADTSKKSSIFSSANPSQYLSNDQKEETSHSPSLEGLSLLRLNRSTDEYNKHYKTEKSGEINKEKQSSEAADNVALLIGGGKILLSSGGTPQGAVVATVKVYLTDKNFRRAVNKKLGINFSKIWNILKKILAALGALIGLTWLAKSSMFSPGAGAGPMSSSLTTSSTGGGVTSAGITAGSHPAASASGGVLQPTPHLVSATSQPASVATSTGISLSVISSGALMFVALISTLTASVIFSSFLTPLPIGDSTVLNEVNNEFVSLSKVATPNNFPSNTTQEVTYTITIKTKPGKLIKLTSVEDSANNGFSFQSARSPHSNPQFSPTGQYVSLGDFGQEAFSGIKSVNYSVVMSGGSNVLVQNLVSITFDVLDDDGNTIKSGEKISTNANVNIGDHGLACWPTSGEVVQLPLASGSFSHSSLDAYDIAAPMGSRVFSPVNGFATAPPFMNNGYGNYAMISFNNDGQNQTMIFAHLATTPLVPSGGKDVQIGDLIGFVGSTGFSTGPHLHYEIKPAGTRGRSNIDKFLVSKGITPPSLRSMVYTCYK